VGRGLLFTVDVGVIILGVVCVFFSGLGVVNLEVIIFHAWECLLGKCPVLGDREFPGVVIFTGKCEVGIVWGDSKSSCKITTPYVQRLLLEPSFKKHTHRETGYLSAS